MGILNRAFTWLLKQAARLDQNPCGNLISALIGIALIGATYWLFVESWFMTLLFVLLFTQVFREALKADTPGQFWSRIITQLQTVLYVDTRRQNQAQSQYGYLGSLFMGIVFSAGWTPCIGPVLASILVIASQADTAYTGMGLLLAYALGLGLPFILMALGLNRAAGRRTITSIKKYIPQLTAASGVLLVAMGLLVFTGNLIQISNWITETFGTGLTI